MPRPHEGPTTTKGECVVTYHLPPDEYRPPTVCEDCFAHITLVPVVGGYGWRHLTRNGEPHDVKLRDEGWFDVATGQTEYRVTVLAGAS